MRLIKLSALIVLVLSLGATGAFATLLAPGGSVAPSNFDASGFNGAILATATGSGTNGSLGGTFNLAVMRDAVSTDLDFLYQFKTNPGSSAVEHITGNSFAAIAGSVDVGYETTNAADSGFFATPVLTDGGSLTPGGVDRSVDGAVVAYDWTGVPAFTGTSYVLVVRTSAKDFVPGFASAIDGGTVTVNGFAPAPEPAYTGLMLFGLFGAGLFAARRFRTSQS